MLIFLLPWASRWDRHAGVVMFHPAVDCQRLVGRSGIQSGRDAGYDDRLGEWGQPTLARYSRMQSWPREKDKKPLQLQFRNHNEYKTIAIPYYEGMRYPSLQRVLATPLTGWMIFSAPSKSPLPSM